MQPTTDRPLPRLGRRKNIGAYDQPFSGVGMEFEPLGAPPEQLEFALHETGYWEKSYGWNFPDVYSPFWRVYYDFREGHFVRFDGESIPLGPDRIVIIPNHQRFDCLGDVPVPQLWMQFSCAWHVDPATEMPIVIAPNATAKAMIAEFPLIFRSRTAKRRERVYRLTLAFVTYLLGNPRIKRQKTLPSHVAAIRDAVNGDPAHPWSGAKFAEMVLMSPDGLTRSFRRWMGMTPTEYVQQVRVREACRLLSQTDETIETIAPHRRLPRPVLLQPRVQKAHERSAGAVSEGAERGGGRALVR